MPRQRPDRRVLLFFPITVAALVCTSPSAFAHAAYESSDPERGARLDEVPTEITVSYAEPPTQQSSFKILDGCEREVGDFGVLNNTIEASVDDAQPGRWRVEWSVISAVDGHLTRDNFSFTVAGEPDCSTVAADDPGDETTGSGIGSLIPVTIATIVIVAIAAAVRRAMR